MSEKSLVIAFFYLPHEQGVFISLLWLGMFPLSAEEPESNRKLHHLLNIVTDALVWVIAKSGIPSQQQTTRLANLLMLLSHIRHAR